jgi:ADP-heptose:LPS heptosyltransferase
MNKIIIFYTRILILLALIFFPVIFFLIWVRRKNRKNKQYSKILVIPQLTRVGDIVCSTPFFAALKEKYSDCSISVLSSLNASGIIENNPNIDEIIIIENYQTDFFKIIKKIKCDKFDAGISLSGTALSSLLFFFGLIPERIKITRPNRPIAEMLTDWLCNKKKIYATPSYLPLFYLGLLKYFGIHKNNVKKEVYVSSDSDKKITAWLDQKGILSDDRVVGMSLTAGNKIKEWGDDKFAILANKIIEQYAMKIVLIGSSHDKERVSNFIKTVSYNDHYIDGTGFSLNDLPALMKRFNYFIAVDTGPIHIAEALGIPLIDILGSVNDIELTPRGKNVRIIKPSVNIPPTIFAFWEAGDKRLTTEAVDSISAGKVFEAFKSLVK